MRGREASVSEQEILDAEPRLESVEQRQRDYVLLVWNVLSTDRAVGLAMGCIPFTAIKAWAEWEGLDRDATMILVDVFQRLEADRIEREDARRRMRGA